MKKIICLLVVIMTCLSATCYAASTTLKDISGTKYENAVNNLTKFEIINGYEDKTFKPNNSVTRAELAKMLMIALGNDESDAKSASNKFLNFSDVLSNHWAYGYIKLASDQKLITGYEDGTFRPDGNVTYAEATAMILRALDYEDGVKTSKLEWPNNYMTYADDLDLFATVPEFKASSNATRGDIAIMLWNALRTGVAEIIAQNSNGLIYGEGEPMISKYLNCIYLENAEIVDVDFEDDYKTAYVTFEQEGKKGTVEYKFDADTVLDMYGQVITLLYDKKNDEMIDLQTENEYKKIESEVSRISSSKIYIVSKTSGYKLPDDDRILLYGIDELEDAVNVVLFVDGTTIKYMIAMGVDIDDVEIALVVNDYYEVDDDEYGIQIREIGAKKNGKGYLLANEDDWPEKGDIILYYINEDDYIIILDFVNPDTAKEISDIDYDEYIKIGKKYYEFEDEDDYTVILSEDSKITLGDIDDIDEDEDYVAVMEYSGHYYFVVVSNGIRSTVDKDVLNAYDALEFMIEYIEEALEYEDIDEADYTQESFAELMKALENAKKQLKYTNTAKKMNNAADALEDAEDGLEKATKSSEKKTVAVKKELRALVNGECQEILEDEKDYTVDSFDYFYEVYEDALDILASYDASRSEIEDILEELEDAIDDLEIKKSSKK